MTSENETAKEKKPKEQLSNPTKPNAYRVDDDDNLEEKDLQRTYLFGDAKMKDANAPGMEGQGMGGQSFGENNLTPAGNDKANPPQNAGEGNAYFRRTQPAEEHPEDENFVAQNQEGEPGKSEPNIPGPQELPDQQKVGKDTKQNDNHKPNPQEEYREGTADNDGQSTPDQKP
jgi:hypothetical protein